MLVQMLERSKSRTRRMSRFENLLRRISQDESLEPLDETAE